VDHLFSCGHCVLKLLLYFGYTPSSGISVEKCSLLWSINTFQMPFFQFSEVNILNVT
jgi:hypothetical protein